MTREELILKKTHVMNLAELQHKFIPGSYVQNIVYEDEIVISDHGYGVLVGADAELDELWEKEKSTLSTIFDKVEFLYQHRDLVRPIELYQAIGVLERVPSRQEPTRTGGSNGST